MYTGKYDTTEIGFQNFAVTFAPVADLYFNKNSKANYAEDLKTEQRYKECSNTAELIINYLLLVSSRLNKILLLIFTSLH